MMRRRDFITLLGAGDRFIDRFIGMHFFAGPALHALARIWAAIKK